MDGTVTIDVSLDLGLLTKGERIWLWRRRQPTARTYVRAGRGGNRMTANEAAALLGIDPKSYCAAELDDPEHVRVVWDAVQGLSKTPRSTSSELCAVARRRSGDTVLGLCVALGGISKPHFNALENSGDPRVVALWQSRGFTF